MLDCCLHDKGITFDLHVAVVMPDHVHLVFTPLIDARRSETHSLAEIMDRIKGASAHLINRKLGKQEKSGRLNPSIACCAPQSNSMRRSSTFEVIRFGKVWSRRPNNIHGPG